jgi:hypothetical protein
MTSYPASAFGLEKSSDDAIGKLVKAFHEGRPIIPFLGAGVSAGSGFPLTEGLREYLCKVTFFIRYSVYRQLLGVTVPSPNKLRPDDREFNPAKYLLEFGWPDCNRLTADLWRYAEAPDSTWAEKQGNDPWWTQLRAESKESQRLRSLEEKKKKKGKKETEQTERNRDLIKRVGAEASYLDRWLTELKKAVDTPPDEQTLPRLEKFRQAAADDLEKHIRNGRPIWGWGRNRLNSLVQFILLEAQSREDRGRALAIEQQVWNHKLPIRGDWFSLLHNLIEGRRGLADELLAQLNRDRVPSLAHLMLVHLTRRLGWRLLLTLNHDSLLERAFASEDIEPKIFDVNALSAVPDSALLRREPLSIVKLHGSAYGLRLGEATNDELDDTTRERLLGYIPPRAVLLVLGFSGYERRMMSLVESVATERRKIHGDDNTQIFWMHWESREKLAEQVTRLESRLSLLPGAGGLQLHRVVDAGLFLKGLYQRLTRTLPSTATNYYALPKRVTRSASPKIDGETPQDGKRRRSATSPAPSAASGGPGGATAPSQGSVAGSSGVTAAEAGTANGKSTGPGGNPSLQAMVHLFVREQMSPLNPTASYPKVPYQGLVVPGVRTESKSSAYLSTSMSEFVRDLGGYDVIWVDLEEHHTVTGVVTAIITTLQVFDPTLPPLVLPVSGIGDEPDCFGRAARFLKRALRRGRYVLAFDSVEGFGRPQTAHHGLVSVRWTDDLEKLFNSSEFKAELPALKSVGDNKLEAFLSAVYAAERSLPKEQRERLMDNIRTLRQDASHYFRLRDLLSFLELLVSEDTIDSTDGDSAAGRRRDPVMHLRAIDWHCCFAIDTPQPRHVPSEKDVHRSYAALTFNALQGFCGMLLDELGTKERPALERPEPWERPLLHIEPINTEEHSTDDLPDVEEGLEDLLNAFHGFNVGKSVGDPGLQQKLDHLIEYCVFRLADASAAAPKTAASPPEAAAAKSTETPGSDKPKPPPLLSTCLDNDAAVLFLMLCVFRRPRNLASIYSLVERLCAMFGDWNGNEEPGPPFDVDKCLERLRKVQLIHLTEGEMYFISQHVHEITYKILAEPLHLSAWDHWEAEDWKQLLANDARILAGEAAEEKSPPNALLRGLWLARIHSHVGRQYYVHIWERSHDPGVLFEYLYHRMAALRYLILTRTRLVLFDKWCKKWCKELWPTERSSAKNFALRSIVRCAMSPADQEKLLNRSATQRDGNSASGPDDLSPPALQDLVDRVDRLRIDYLNALLNVIDRERPTIYASAPGDTWINWIRQMLQVDLDEIFGYAGGPRASDATSDFQEAWRDDNSREICDLSYRLELELRDIHGRIFREMGEYEECLKARLDLFEIIGSQTERKTERKQEHHRAGPRGNGSLAAKLNSLEGALEVVATLRSKWTQPPNPSKNPEIIPSFNYAAERLGSVERLSNILESALIDMAAAVRHLKSVGGDPKSPMARDFLQAYLAFQDKWDDALEKLQMSLVPGDADDSKPSKDPKDEDPKDVALPLARAAIHNTRSSLQVAGLRYQFEIHRFIVDDLEKDRFRLLDPAGKPTADGNAVRKQATRALADLRGTERRIYGTPFYDERDFILQVSQFTSLQATLVSLRLTRPSFDESLRLFEEAESGLKSSYPPHLFHRIILSTKRAYALMLLADSLVRRTTIDDPLDERQSLLSDKEYRKRLENELPAAQQRLAEARGELMRAERLLGVGRRNVRVWHRLYVARAQLVIEDLLRLLLSLEFNRPGIAEEHQFVAEIQDLLLTGLEAIRGALDCSATPKEGAFDTTGDYRTCVERYLSLFVLARLVLRTYASGANASQDGSRPVWDTLCSQGQLAGAREFFDRWAALNQSVGLWRFFRVFAGPPQLQTLGKPKASSKSAARKDEHYSWFHVVDLVDDPILSDGGKTTDDEFTTMREVALFKLTRVLEKNSVFVRRFLEQRRRIIEVEERDRLAKENNRSSAGRKRRK